jgi:arginine:ornithine antiporter/lysine permease
VPATALWLSNVVIQVFIFVTWFAESAFVIALKMTSAMTLVPYLLVAAYGLKLAWSGETYGSDPHGRRGDGLRAAIATAYAAAMLYAGGAKFLLLSALLYAPGTLLYFRARREQRALVFTAAERLVFGVVALAGLVALVALASGRLTI